MKKKTPFIDSWDKRLHDSISKVKCANIEDRIRNFPAGSEWDKYLADKQTQWETLFSPEPKATKGDTSNRTTHTASKMFGILGTSIPFAEQKGLPLRDVIYSRFKKMRDNRTAFRLVDLHEMSICCGQSPNQLLGYSAVDLSSIIDIIYFDVLDMVQIEQNIRDDAQNEFVPFRLMIRANPFLGLFLIANFSLTNVIFEMCDLFNYFPKAAGRTPGNPYIQIPQQKSGLCTTTEKYQTALGLYQEAVCYGKRFYESLSDIEDVKEFDMLQVLLPAESTEQELYLKKISPYIKGTKRSDDIMQYFLKDREKFLFENVDARLLNKPSRPKKPSLQENILCARNRLQKD